MEKATFAAGCFWGVEKAFRKISGVKSTQVGYAGGHKENPSYEEVCTGATGHAESIEVTYDPAVVSYAELLHAFFEMHDPTSWHRQGPDVGSQYRSVVFYHTPDQKAAVLGVIDELNRRGKLHKQIVTEVMPAGKFFRAEEYHQRYLEK